MARVQVVWAWVRVRVRVREKKKISKFQNGSWMLQLLLDYSSKN